MKKIVFISLILIVFIFCVNLSYADIEYEVLFDRIDPIDDIGIQPIYEIEVTLDNQVFLLGETLTVLNPYLIIDMKSYSGEILVYSGHKEKLLQNKTNRIKVKAERVNEIGEYSELYYWFWFYMNEIEVTPTPVITETPIPTIVSITPVPTKPIYTHNPTISSTISPTISADISPTSNEVLPSNEIVSGNDILLSNKSLPKTGEKSGFSWIAGGLIVLLGTFILVAKIKKKE